MRCVQCGREMEQTGAISQAIRLGVYQTTRYYKCKNCGATKDVVLEPMEVEQQ